MAADVISAAGLPVHLYEKRKSAGRKLLIAGSSGLNITNAAPLPEFIAHYKGGEALFPSLLADFPPSKWIEFIEELGTATFKGTSERYFIEDMKASLFLKAWTERLKRQGVEFRFGKELTGFESAPNRILFQDGSTERYAHICFALGGASWEPTETPLRWPSIFKSKGLAFTEFTSSNVGYQVAWSDAFLKEAEGKPLKKIILRSARATREGDAMITKYGIEGTPVYFAGQTGLVHFDLRPDLNQAQIIDRLNAVRENLSPIRRIKKQLSLGEASLALVFHHTPPALKDERDLKKWAALVKHFPLVLGEPQPLTEAISSAGGLSFAELTDQLELKRYPGFFAAGEMLDWDVPTGGFLIQGAVAQGYRVGQAIVLRST